ncbi:MAG: transketolase [Oscillospiraceae bacterium]|nr:transketolase [Oscillospiraceae bacterium]
MFQVKKTILDKDPRLMRDVYCDTLIELAKNDPRICALDADLMGSSGMKPFMKEFPGRFFDVGIAEANMIGVAAGLSATGKIPFAHSFGVFSSRRVCDQIFMSAAYAKLNVRIIGSDPGVTAAYNGGTHMPFEDMGVLRSIPQITLLEPSDPVMLGDLTRQLADTYGVYYIRMARKDAVSIYQDGSTFEIGKGNVLVEGRDVTIMASGIMVAEAIKAAIVLENEGLSVRVVDLFTWKPMDTELVARCAAETGAIVTAENHNTLGGLGAAVAEAVTRTCPCPMEMVGTDDRFGQVGTEAFLRKEYDLTADRIIRAAKTAIERKKKH